MFNTRKSSALSTLQLAALLALASPVALAQLNPKVSDDGGGVQGPRKPWCDSGGRPKDPINLSLPNSASKDGKTSTAADPQLKGVALTAWRVPTANGPYDFCVRAGVLNNGAVIPSGTVTLALEDVRAWDIPPKQFGGTGGAPHTKIVFTPKTLTTPIAANSRAMLSDAWCMSAVAWATRPKLALTLVVNGSAQPVTTEQSCVVDFSGPRGNKEDLRAALGVRARIPVTSSATKAELAPAQKK